VSRVVRQVDDPDYLITRSVGISKEDEIGEWIIDRLEDGTQKR